MLAFSAPRLVLLSVPKTGTTSLYSALIPHAQVVMDGRPELKHVTLRQYQRHMAPLFKGVPGPAFRIVATIREPRSWLGSWYRYRARPDRKGNPRSTIGISFEQFVTDYLSDEPRPAYASLGRQSGFLSPLEGRNGPDFLFRYEALDALVSFMEAAVGAPLALKRRNVSPAGDLTLTPRTEALLRERMAEDQAMWEAALVQAP